MTSRPPLTPLFALLLIRGIASFQLQAAAVVVLIELVLLAEMVALVAAVLARQ